MTDLIANVELITPEIAKEYLTHNTNNYRNLSQATVKNYAEDMRNGTFRENGEAIQFSADGALKNGQHRLNAIILSGVAMRMVVVRGVADDIDEYDWGKVRKIGDWGKANGLYLPSAISGAAKAIVCGFNKENAKGKVTKFIEQNYDDLREAYSIATHGNNKSIGRRSGVVLAVYLCRKYGLVNDFIMRDFFQVFNTGTLSENQMRDPSPALVSSRQFLIRFPPATGGSSVMRRQLEVIMLALKDFKTNKNRRKEYSMDGTYGYEYLIQLQREINSKEAVV